MSPGRFQNCNLLEMDNFRHHGVEDKPKIMKRPFGATVWREGTWYVSQCLDLDVASQGETEEEALANLKEALELHFKPPQATRSPDVRTIEVEVGAA